MSVTIYKYREGILLKLPFVENGIKAGFPSPAEDFTGKRISLDETLIVNKEATYFAKVDGDSMKDAGMSDGDLLVIDKSLEPRDGKIAVCMLEGEFTVKRLRVNEEGVFLVPENKAYPTIKLEEGEELTIWGIVTFVIKAL